MNGVGEVAESVFVKTQGELGERLNASRKSIQRWFKEDGCPGKSDQGYNVTLWQMWVGERGKAPRAIVPLTKQELDSEHMRLKNEKLSIEIAVRRGELASWDEVNKTLTEMMSAFVGTMRQMKHHLGPQVVGVDIGEAAKRIGRMVDENLTELSLGGWAEKKTFWCKVYAHLQDLHRRYNLGDGLSVM